MTEIEQLNSRLRKDQPEFVKNFRLAFEDDVDGDPAVWVWVVVGDDEVAAADFPEHSETTRSWISTALSDTHIKRWLYVRFRAESEVESAEARAQ